MRRASLNNVLLCLGVMAAFGAAVALTVAAGASAAASPAAETQPAREVNSTSVTLTGSANPAGEATTYAFQYGTSTQYAQETAPQSAGSGTSAVAVSATVTGLQPGTTYHFRLLAANATGTTAGRDMTVKTMGLAPPSAALPTAATGPASALGTHAAVLTGTIGPSGAQVSYYFQIGTREPYELQTLVQARPASGSPSSVTATIEGLQSDQTYHYRLIAVDENGERAAGSDQSFTTVLAQRANPIALEANASPRFQRAMPDVVTVSGRLIAPQTLDSNPLACEGFVDIAFRVHTIAMQMLRAGLHSNCTFSLPVRFSDRRRLLGGHVEVHVLFPGNQLLHRLAAPVQRIQVG